jgi:hypothetical protein
VVAVVEHTTARVELEVLEVAEQDVVIILLRGKVPLQILAVAVVLADIQRHQDL